MLNDQRPVDDYELSCAGMMVRSPLKGSAHADQAPVLGPDPGERSRVRARVGVESLIVV